LNNGIFYRRAGAGVLAYETSWVEVTNELVAKFWRWEELFSRLQGPGVRICELLVGPPPSQARWADRLAEAA
jgi:hypothetical protein